MSRQETGNFSAKTNELFDDTQKAGGIAREIEEAAALGAEATRANSALRGNALELSARDIDLSDNGRYVLHYEQIGRLRLEKTFTGFVTIGIPTGTLHELNQILVYSGTISFSETDIFVIRNQFYVDSGATVYFSQVTVGFPNSSFFCGVGNVIALFESKLFFHNHSAMSIFNFRVIVKGDSEICANPKCGVCIDSFDLRAPIELRGGGVFFPYE